MYDASWYREERIERQVERLFDALDARLTRGELSQAEYDRQAEAIHAWAEAQYAEPING